MPVGQPDSNRRPRESELSQTSPVPWVCESLADRLIRAAMESGEFEALEGEGKPIPGAGTPDDAGWWVRSWLERNSIL